MATWIWLGIGSLAGGYSRYILTGTIHKFFSPTFPYGTLIVNLTGCFLIGLFHSLAENKLMLGPQGRIFLMTGFCGAFTTFSAFILENILLVKNGDWARAAFYIGGSVILGCLAFLLADYMVNLF
jgi:CrcB protein